MGLFTRRNALAWSLPVLAGAAALVSPAQAEVRRCERNDGSMIFTDKPCASLGAQDHVAKADPQTATRGRLVRDCPRTVPDLVFEITTAIDSLDVNRLASLYHWQGMSSSAGYKVLGTLDAIVNRPLVDVTPLMADNATDEAYASAPSTPAVSATSDPAASNTGDTTPTLISPAPRSITRQPIAIRIDQTLLNTATPSQTRFTLVRNLDCWWIEQ